MFSASGTVPRLFCRFLRPTTAPCRLAMAPAASSSSSSSSPRPPPPAPKAVRVVVKGRVQGVFFRDWTVETARALGLAGWVRNRRDGSVEALFSGDPAKVNDMVSRHLHVGPPAAAVTGILPSPADPIDPSEGFHRKPTV